MPFCTNEDWSFLSETIGMVQPYFQFQTAPHSGLALSLCSHHSMAYSAWTFPLEILQSFGKFWVQAIVMSSFRFLVWYFIKGLEFYFCSEGIRAAEYKALADIIIFRYIYLRICHLNTIFFCWTGWHNAPRICHLNIIFFCWTGWHNAPLPSPVKR